MRMSQVGDLRRTSLIKSVQRASRSDKAAAAPDAAPVEDLVGSDTALDERLTRLNLAQHTMQGDGNCQFRALAFNLFGTQSHHLVIRRSAVEHMTRHVDYFKVFFEDEDEFKNYLRGMSRDRTWGDELTLRAVVEAYGCVAHVLTSEEDNWYLVYSPETPDTQLPEGAVPEDYQAPPQGKEVFISYVSPVHYNAVVASVYRGPSAYGDAPPTPRPIDSPRLS